MKFEKFPLASYEIEEFVTKRFSSKRSLAAGKRAVKKQKEKWGLFYDELAEFKSAEERRDKLIKKYIKIYRDWRKQEAAFWKRIRKKYFALPKELREKVKFVYERSPARKKAHNLGDLIHIFKTDRKRFDEYYEVVKELDEKGFYKKT